MAGVGGIRPTQNPELGDKVFPGRPAAGKADFQGLKSENHELFTVLRAVAVPAPLGG